MSGTTSPELPNAAGDGPLSYAIFQLARAHRGHAAAMLRAMNLHPGQELLLMQLFDRDGQTQAELLERVGLDHSTVSKSLRRMQEAGLLTREPAPTTDGSWWSTSPTAAAPCGSPSPTCGAPWRRSPCVS